MKIEVLGASGSQTPGSRLPALLIDDSLLLDAGNVAGALDLGRQCRISHVLLTHAHLDHVGGLPFFIENLVVSGTWRSVELLSGSDVLAELRRHLFNGSIWPDFTKIPDKRRPALRLTAISPARSVWAGEHRIRCDRVSHTVPAYGYIIGKARGEVLAYTGDTGPTNRFWRSVSRRRADCLIVEVSFPDSLAALARLAGHLTPSLLKGELGKLTHVPSRIYVIHCKAPYRDTIREELDALGLAGVGILEDGQVIEIPAPPSCETPAPLGREDRVEDRAPGVSGSGR